MADMLGMDVQAGDDLARKLQEQSQKIEQIIHEVDGKVKSLVWKGKDADTFKQDWEGCHKKALRQAKDLLQNNSEKLKKEVQQQRQTSGMGV